MNVDCWGYLRNVFSLWKYLHLHKVFKNNNTNLDCVDMQFGSTSVAFKKKKNTASMTR